jgi:DNA-binding NarL/FixJ family response regulator
VGQERDDSFGSDQQMAQSPLQNATGTNRPRIAIADQNPVVRQGLKDFIGKDDRFDVVGVVRSGHEFLNLVEEQPIDIGVVGWSLPGLTGGEVLSELKRRQSKTRVVIYTGATTSGVLRQAILLGAWALVSKSELPVDLLDTIAAVAHGRFSFPCLDLRAVSKNPLDEITARELELLSALTYGLTNQQIASRFGISHNTVKYHLKNLYDKLGVNNRAMAITLLLSEPRNK